jgi:hypothetical protein
MQWCVLRRQVGRTGWWVLASTLIWAVVIWAVSQVSGDSVLSGAVFGIVYAIVTGIALVWLLRHPVSATPSLGQRTTQPRPEM